MSKNNILDQDFDDIEGYLDDDFEDDEFSYLNVSPSDDFEQYLDFRAARKTSRKGRGKKGGRGEARRRSS